MVIAFRKGEDFQKTLKNFLERNRINSGFFYGIGGFLKAELAFYDLKTKEYKNKKIPGPLEVVSLVGNVAQGAKGVIVHAHAALGKKDFSMIGGHLVNAIVGGTLELKLTQTEMLERKFDDETGLNLLK